MEENNRKGPGVFYAVVGVATLVVAIIGATFAYFSATVDPVSDVVKGQTAAPTSATLRVTPVYPTDEGKQGTNGRMLPMNDADLATALGKSCMADDGYVACQVYKVELTNDGNESIYANSELQLTVGTIANLKWQRLTGDVGTFAASGDAVTDVETKTLLGTSNTETIASKAAVTYYFVVWLSNLSENQSVSDAGQSFTGTVSANITNSTGDSTTGLVATFSA